MRDFIVHVELTYRYEQNVVVRARTEQEALELAPDMTSLDLPAPGSLYVEAAIVDPDHGACWPCEGKR